MLGGLCAVSRGLTRGAASAAPPAPHRRPPLRPRRLQPSGRTGGCGGPVAMVHAAAEALLGSLPDAHAHPQLDADNAARTAALRVPCVAAMGVAADVDWARVEHLAALAGPEKLIPGFGIHPWWSHLHASAVGATWEELLEAPSPEEKARAVGLLAEQAAKQGGGGGGGASDAGARYEAARSGPAATAATGEGPPGSSTGGISSAAGPTGSDGSDSAGASTSARSGVDSGGGGGGGGRPEAVVPAAAWRARLRALLAAHPGAVVGEVGVDRAAVIPGTRARVRFDHQLALLAEQIVLAAELRRPVSVHCVRGYGHLLALFAGLPGPDACPPAVMLHSYGGSPEEVARFTRLRGIGGRFYFSFSAAINGRHPDKLAARLRAVPDDRLLLESDQVTPLLIDSGMAAICEVAAAAKGWSLEETAARAAANFNAFYGR